MTALEALGKLIDCSSFPCREVDVALLRALEKSPKDPDASFRAWCNRDLISALVRCGRNDLAEIIKKLSVR